MHYTHVVFDIDNTLINTIGAVPHGLQRALKDITGEHWDTNRPLPVLGIPGLDALGRLGIRSPGQVLRIYPWWGQREQEYQHVVYLCRGIVPLLDFLKKKGCSLGIITSRTMPQYTRSFPLLQVSGYFQTVIAADGVICRKPDPGPMLEYMKRTGACPWQTPCIGDNVCDIQYVSRVGADSCLALWGCHYPDDISSTHRFEDLTAIVH